MSKTICCVEGCSNSLMKCRGMGIAFYKYPSKPYEADRRQKWIAAVNRRNLDGSYWQPTRHTRICSVHFVGGKASNVPSSPGYAPSIFPPPNKKKRRSLIQRVTRDGTIIDDPLPLPDDTLVDPEDTFYILRNYPTLIYTSKLTEVRMNYDRSYFEFTCLYQGNDTATQCNIGGTLAYSAIRAEKCCGPSTTNDLCLGFRRFETIEKEEFLRELTGVTYDNFVHLKSLVPLRGFAALNADNAMLLFLIRMKLGISFAALGALFNVHRTTAMRIFVVILETLAVKKDDLYFKPKVSGRRAVPDILKKKIHNFIGDCDEYLYLRNVLEKEDEAGGSNG